MLYNLSEFMTKIKEDMGIKDIPLPVDDSELVKRFHNSALKEFSIRVPYLQEFVLDQKDALNLMSQSINGSVTYRIPPSIYQDTPILNITHLAVSRTGGYSDYYIPTGTFNSPDFVLETIADIKLAAQLGAQVSHAPTWRFDPPDKVTIYNGWSGGSYVLEAAMMHDLSLSTIPPTAFTDLIYLATLDIEEYLYNKLKRKENLSLGIGEIQLRIDSWENAGQTKRDLLKEWDENGANLNFEPISYW